MTNLVRKQRKQNNVSEWGDTSTSGLLFQWARTIKETIKRVGLVQSRHHHNFFEYNLHSLTHSLTHSLAHSLARSLSRSLALSLWLTDWLTDWLTLSLSHTHTHTLTHSLTHSLHSQWGDIRNNRSNLLLI